MRDEDFARQLNFGKKGELFAMKVIPHMIEFDDMKVNPQGKFSDWDLCYTKTTNSTFYEVKRDSYTHRTNNICIEHHSDGEPSGISITKADYYFYVVDNEHSFFVIPVDVLKKNIQEKKYHSNRFVGYRNLSHCYFFDRKLYEDYEYEYDPMDFQGEA
jgi:hypothetical protein